MHINKHLVTGHFDVCDALLFFFNCFMTGHNLLIFYSLYSEL